MEPILQARRLSKTYRNGRGVRDVSFELCRGEVYGLFGPNGSGKTTVLKLLSGLCKADGGSVLLFGYDVAERFEPAMSRVGCIVETADVYDYMSGYDNLKLAARLYPGLPATRMDEVLDWVRLTPYKREKAGAYSLGMKQRLALAAALLHGPELVILDEPTNGLDIDGAVELRELILRLSAENGTAFLLSSHQLDEMERVCDRIGFMYDGALIREGAVGDLTGEGGLERAYLADIRRAREGAGANG